MRKYAALIALMGLFCTACVTQTASVRDGQEYGVTKGTFRGKWWSYYERGASYQSGQFYDQAAADLKKAVAGRDRDTWQARTYGLHFVEYFPNRELGVTYYHLGRLDEAEQYLTASIQQIDTARGHQYLDLVKRARIAKGELKDTTAPGIETSIRDGMVVASRQLSLDVRTKDDTGVAQVRINGALQHQRGSTLDLDMKKELVFEEGDNTVSVTAADLSDKESTQSLTVKVDLTGPSIGILDPAPESVTQAASIRLRGVTVDGSGVASVSLGERVLAEGKGQSRLDFNAELPLADGTNDFVLIAKDVAGNETRSLVSVFRGKPTSPGAFWMRWRRLPEEMRRLAMARYDNAGLLAGVTAALEVIKSAVENAGNPIQIELKFPKGDTECRQNEVRVTGRVAAQGPLASLTINDKKFDLAPAPTVEFSRRIALARGENKISIRVQDTAGHSAERTVTITGKQILLDTPESKMSVAVLAFGGAVDENTRNMLRLRTDQMVSEGNRFAHVDRAHLADVLGEQRLSAALADPESALQLGKIKAVNVFLVGEVIGHEQGRIEIAVKVINTETSIIETPILDTYIDDKNDEAKVKYGIDGLADGLAKMFPRVAGDIVKADGKTVVTNIGKEEGVRPGMYMQVVHEEPPTLDPKTGEVLIQGEYTMLGKAVVKVVDKGSKAEVVDIPGSAKLEAGMPVITM